MALSPWRLQICSGRARSHLLPPPLSQSDLRNITWADVLAKLKLAQKEFKMNIRKHELTELGQSISMISSPGFPGTLRHAGKAWKPGDEANTDMGTLISVCYTCVLLPGVAMCVLRQICPKLVCNSLSICEFFRCVPSDSALHKLPGGHDQ